MLSRTYYFASFSNKLIISGFALLSCFSQSAFGQRNYDPNFNHFYMGRQQWTIEDNSPVIMNRTDTAPGAMNGALPNRPALPKAGWQGYAPIDNATQNNNLPKASSHSVKTKNSSANSKTGHIGHAGNLTGNKSSSGINSYKPYATYSNPVSTPNAGPPNSTSTHVKGDLLHWARRTSKPQ